MLHITLTDEQRTELGQAARQALGRVCERIHFVLLSDQGHSPPKIGTLLGYDAATVRTWLTAYQAQGLAGLDDAPRSGRPLREKHLVAIAQAQTSQPPPNFGYLQACWTIVFLATHLWQRFRIKVSASTLRRAVHAAGFTWHRPKLVLVRKADPLADEKLVHLQAALTDPKATVIAEDECDVHLLAVLRAMWQRQGEQVRIPTPGQNAKRGVFGACDLRTGRWFYQLTERKRSVEFIAFLGALVTAYPLGVIYVIVDNASLHTSKAVQTWVQANSRLQLVYLPTYSGHQLNPVEKIWWDLKADIAANRGFKTLVDLDQAIRRHFTQLSAAGLLALINCETVRQAQAAIAQKC
ncbi:MAG: family transposase [Chloroflexota bacterium]|nr:family transposase [Chloroflexota bacterium]